MALIQTYRAHPGFFYGVYQIKACIVCFLSFSPDFAFLFFCLFPCHTAEQGLISNRSDQARILYIIRKKLVRIFPLLPGKKRLFDPLKPLLTYNDPG